MKQRLRPSRNLTLVGGNEAVTATARGTMEKTMKAKWLTLTLALAFAGGAAFAHGNKVHVKGDRKSTRLNSSHQIISYAVFCLKKKKGYSMIQSTDAATRTA